MGDRSFALGSARVHVWEPDATPRALVQLQHGFGEYAERYVHGYQRLIPRLLGLGFEVWAMDLEGHGHAPGRRGSVDVVRAVADHAALRGLMLERGSPVLLFGHSLGGLVSAASVLTAPQGVRGAVLTGPGFLPPAPPGVCLTAGLVASLFPHLPAPRPRARRRRRTPGKRVNGDPMLFTGRASMRVAAGVLRTSERIWQNLDQWRTPCLVAHGTADTFTDHEQSVRFAQRSPSSDITLHLVEGGRHELLHEKAGDEVLELVLAWLEEHSLD